MLVTTDVFKKGLDRERWWSAFLACHEMRTGLEEEDFDKRDVLTAYYSPDTTPYEAVTEDIEKYGLDEL